MSKKKVYAKFLKHVQYSIVKGVDLGSITDEVIGAADVNMSRYLVGGLFQRCDKNQLYQEILHVKNPSPLLLKCRTIMINNQEERIDCIHGAVNEGKEVYEIYLKNRIENEDYLELTRKFVVERAINDILCLRTELRDLFDNTSKNEVYELTHYDRRSLIDKISGKPCRIKPLNFSVGDLEKFHNISLSEIEERLVDKIPCLSIHYPDCRYIEDRKRMGRHLYLDYSTDVVQYVNDVLIKEQEEKKCEETK